MKNSITLILLIFLLAAISYSQEDTFGRLYRQHNTIYSVQETMDGGFILSGNKGLIKTNNVGRIEWQNFTGSLDRFNLPLYGANQALQDENETYLFDHIQAVGEFKQFCINRYSSTGILLTSQVILEAENLALFSCQKTFDSGYMVLLIINEEYSSPILLKLNNDLEIEWQSSFQSSVSYRSAPHVTQTLDSGFVAIGINGQLTKFNAIGDTLWTNFDTPRFYLINELQDSTFLVAGYNLLGRLDKNGVLITQDSIGIVNPNSLFVNNNENAIYLTGLSNLGIVAKYDFSFNNIWTDSLDQNTLNSVFINSYNKVIITGTFEKNTPSKGFLLQANSAGNYDYLMLVDPQDMDYLQVSNQLDIRWATTLTGNINIKYSVKNGTDWQNIITDYPAESEHFEWQLPGLPSNQLLIRIESTSQPVWYDQNDFPVILARKSYDYIAINECRMWFGNDGDGSHDPITEKQGFFWPGGKYSSQGAIFEDGLVWAGLVDGVDTVANGNTFLEGLQPGNILKTGEPTDKNDNRFGIWKAQRDWQLLPEGFEKDRLKYDWENWPVDLGAPWIDNNQNGFYEFEVDEPEIVGDELNWMVMNDLDTAMTQYTYGSDPIGLEVRLSIYAYNQDNDLKDVIFKKYKIYNKGQHFVKDMYLGYWSDPDLGAAHDDYSGCDTSLNLAFTWNGKSADEIYGVSPPAQGYLILQGPVVPAINKKARFFDQWFDGFENLNIAGFAVYDYWGIGMWDASQGVKKGSAEMYNNIRGRQTHNGEYFIDPNTNNSVEIALTGDPVTGTGWYMGDGWPGGPNPDDVRLIMGTGPFDFAPGDSQEVVYAIIMAQGDNNLDSITEIKRKAAAVKEFYYTGVLPVAIEDEKPVKPLQFALSQNYPNPFNPNTVISYKLKVKSDVKLFIYDALGRVVKVLAKGSKAAGSYNVNFDATGLATGIYYYRLQAGDFVQTKKMLLLR